MIVLPKSDVLNTLKLSYSTYHVIVVLKYINLAVLEQTVTDMNKPLKA